MLNPGYTALLATLACGTLSARCALTFFTSVPRLFTATALLSLAWLMMLPFYNEVLQKGSENAPTSSSTLLVACGSYLLVVAGSLARRSTVSSDAPVEVMDRYALLLLLPLATGSKPDLLKAIDLNENQFETILASSLGALGYLGLWHAVRSLKPSPGSYGSFTAIAFSYSGLDMSYLVYTLFHPDRSMPAVLVYLFAAAKLALTSAFLYILIAVVYPQMKPLKMVNALAGGADLE